MIEKRLISEDAVAARSDAAVRFSAMRSGALAEVLAGAIPLSTTPTDGLLAVLWRHRWAMLLCIVMAVGGAVAYIRTVTPVYTSTAKLYLDYAGVRISNPYEPGGRPQTDKYLCTQAELIKSAPILTHATEALMSRRLRTLDDAEAPVAYLQENMVVDVGKKDEIISISVRSPYAVEAAEIVNRVVDAYMTSRSEREQRNSAQVLKVLEDELIRSEKELNEKRNELTDFQINHMPLSLGSDQGGGVMQRYLEFQDAYTQAQIKRMDAEEFRRTIQALAKNAVALRRYIQLRSDISAYAGTDQERAPLEARVLDLERQREGFLERFTPDHPTVVGLTAEVDRIGTRLTELDSRFVKAVIAAAEQRYVEAKSYEEQVARSYNQEQEQVVTLNGEIAQYQRLRAEVAELTEYFQMRAQEVRDFRKIVGEDVGQLQMAVLESAVPANVPSEPQKARIMAMALLLAVLLGGGIVVARDRADQTLRSTDEISASLRVPVLGAVPAMSHCRRMRQRGQRVFLQPDSREAEAFRTIRTAVFFGAPQDRAKTVLITSSAAGEGKSTLVSNLAIAMARAGQKTLILDADFRKPTQQAIFELDHRERCLSSVLAGKMELAEAIQPSRIEGLHVLTCGQGLSNPAEVLHSRQFARLLECLTETYDRIVVDAPPLIVVTDAQILGALCDVTLLVLKADKSTRRVAQRAIDALGSVGAHLLGVVVNEVRKAGDRYGYCYGRYRTYRGSDSRRAAKSVPRNSITAGQEPKGLPVRTASNGT